MSLIRLTMRLLIAKCICRCLEEGMCLCAGKGVRHLLFILKQQCWCSHIQWDECCFNFHKYSQIIYWTVVISEFVTQTYSWPNVSFWMHLSHFQNIPKLSHDYIEIQARVQRHSKKKGKWCYLVKVLYTHAMSHITLYTSHITIKYPSYYTILDYTISMYTLLPTNSIKKIFSSELAKSLL